MIPKFLMICISQVMPYSVTLGDHTEHGSLVYRTPPHCTAGILPEKFGPPAPQPQPTAAAPEPPKVTPRKKAKGCKPGRVRDSRGICRRKR